MVISIKKLKLQTALQAVRKAYQSSVRESIINEPQKPYIQIALEHGCSEQWVLDVARRYGIGRSTPKGEGVANGQKNRDV